jgi:hypothetical protein
MRVFSTGQRAPVIVGHANDLSRPVILNVHNFFSFKKYKEAAS